MATEASFGPEVGGLLISQAHCEETFDSTNCCFDSVHMADLNDDAWESVQAQNDAIRNAQRIKSNILKLVHIFRREDMQAKLAREFKEVRPSQSEIEKFNNVYDKTK